MKSTQEIVQAIASGEVGASELTAMVKESVQGLAVAEVLAERNAIYTNLGFGVMAEDISDLVEEEESEEEESEEEDEGKEEKEEDDE